MTPDRVRGMVRVVEGEDEGFGPTLTITFASSTHGLRAAILFLERLWDQNERLKAERFDPVAKLQ